MLETDLLTKPMRKKMKIKIILISICLSFLNFANADDHVEIGGMAAFSVNLQMVKIWMM